MSPLAWGIRVQTQARPFPKPSETLEIHLQDGRELTTLGSSAEKITLGRETAPGGRGLSRRQGRGVNVLLSNLLQGHTPAS